MRQRAIIGALLLIGVGVALGATVFRTDIAQATRLAQSVTVDNTTANPVPVTAASTLPIHEQGTANVNVTNSSIAVAAPAPITDGGHAVEFVCGNTATPPDVVATALSIHMTSGVFAVNFYLGTLSNIAATFMGPEETGPSDVQLTLNRPIKFDHIQCIGLGTARISVSWVGNLP